jgi:hypothetical protein
MKMEIPRNDGDDDAKGTLIHLQKVTSPPERTG